jgi:hypothetical protein
MCSGRLGSICCTCDIPFATLVTKRMISHDLCFIYNQLYGIVIIIYLLHSGIGLFYISQFFFANPYFQKEKKLTLNYPIFEQHTYIAQHLMLNNDV